MPDCVDCRTCVLGLEATRVNTDDDDDTGDGGDNGDGASNVDASSSSENGGGASVVGGAASVSGLAIGVVVVVVTAAYVWHRKRTGKGFRKSSGDDDSDADVRRGAKSFGRRGRKSVASVASVEASISVDSVNDGGKSKGRSLPDRAAGAARHREGDMAWEKEEGPCGGGGGNAASADPLIGAFFTIAVEGLGWVCAWRGCTGHTVIDVICDERLVGTMEAKGQWCNWCKFKRWGVKVVCQEV